MHLIQSLMGLFTTQPSRPGRAAAAEYSLVAGLVLAASGVGLALALGRLQVALAALPL